MNIIKKISELKNLTNNEQILADFIVQKPQEVINYRASELATHLYISVATIYRLINKMEISGYNELKIQLLSCMKEENKHRDIDYNYPIMENDTPGDIACNLQGLYADTIEETINYFDGDELLEIAKWLKKAKVIDVYASSANIYFANNFKFQMQEMGVLINVPVEGYTQELSAANSNDEHVAIVISYGGRSTTINKVVKILKENNINMLLITSLQDNPLMEYAKYKLFFASSENHYHKISSFSTRLSLLYILDVLYSTYFNVDYEENIDFKLHNYQKMNKELK